MSSLSEIKFLTVAEVATVMRVSKMTVYRLVHSGELASVRVGRSFRVPSAPSTTTCRWASARSADPAHAGG
jgi:excisionase family DNA binding protein